MVFNDEQKNDIAWQEYTKYKVGNKVKIDTDNKKKTIGYVSEVFWPGTRRGYGFLSRRLESTVSRSSIWFKWIYCDR